MLLRLYTVKTTSWNSNKQTTVCRSGLKLCGTKNINSSFENIMIIKQSVILGSVVPVGLLQENILYNPVVCACGKQKFEYTHQLSKP